MTNKISKVIITLIIAFAVVSCMCTSVFADAGDDAVDLSGSLLGGSGSTTEEPEETEQGTELEKTEPEETEPEETKQEEAEPEEENKKTYEESIPYAGPADTVLMLVAFLALGGIGIYTFIKLSEYSNI